MTNRIRGTQNGPDGVRREVCVVFLTGFIFVVSSVDELYRGLNDGKMSGLLACGARISIENSVLRISNNAHPKIELLMSHRVDWPAEQSTGSAMNLVAVGNPIVTSSA